LGWRPGPGKVGQNNKAMLSLLRRQQKIPNPNNKKMLIEIRKLPESVDGLNTFLSLSTGE